ncbi:MAG: hypothetical protein A2Z70_01075 [Chloroflexi bacterium RBG_13_48_17]|nr:MAG: hypothetical protein A2Z70_01075 [Chloroflexi bacterium RBG_13_48_17]
MKENPNILFVCIPTLPLDLLRESFAGESPHPQILTTPLGILYLSAYMKKNNDIGKVGLLDYNAFLPNIVNYTKIEEYLLAEIDNQVKFEPDIIGISYMFTTSYSFFEVMIPIIRKRWPKALIVVGGIHATNYYKLLLASPNIDIVVRGEGEIAFTELIKQYSNNTHGKIRGVIHKDDVADELHALTVSDQITNLDELPLPDWDLCAMERYATSTGRRRSIGDTLTKRIASIMTTRGCPFKCTFCAAHSINGRKLRFRSIDKVMEEITALNKRYGITLIDINDDLFNAKKDRTILLLKKFKALRIPDLELQIPSGLYVNLLDKDIIDAIIECDIKIVNFAVESGSAYVQKNIIKKNVNLDKAKELVKYCRSKGLTVRCFFIFGFPDETKDLMEETVNYIKELKSDWCTFFIATPLKGAEIYDEFLKRGYIQENMELLSSLFLRDRTFDTKEISAVDLQEFIYRLNLDINFVNNPNFGDGDFDKAIDLFNDILSVYHFHIFALYGLYLSYIGKGAQQEAENILHRIKLLVQSNEQSKEMYHKYKDLLPTRLIEN